MPYLVWDTQTITDFLDSSISAMYQKGFVFTRKGKGIMNKTRSLRIDLAKFNLHTKNKRVLRITDGLNYEILNLPLGADDYNWEIHKLGKDYYEKKFGKDVFSASKIKELVTDSQKSNYNTLVKFTKGKADVGYVIAYKNPEMMHYAYPFYDLEKYANHYGMGMMLRAILYAQDQKLKYFYLGSVSRPADIYKLYFRGLEWFDGNIWRTDIDYLKTLIK